MSTRWWPLGAGVLVLIGVQDVHGQGNPSGAAVAVGARVRVDIAGQYRADGIAIDEGSADVVGRIVRRDELTLTVSSPGGRDTRYPAFRARLVGRLTALEADWLTLDLGDAGPEVRVPRLAIGRLEASRGTRTSAREGALLGAVVPGVPLGLFMLTAHNFLVYPTRPPGPRDYAGAAVGVALGAGLGALVGSLFETERWEEVSVGISVGPQSGGGVAGALTLRF